MYLTKRDANMRLQGTVIRKGGVPILVAGFSSKNMFEYTVVGSDAEGHLRAKLSDADVDVTPIPLGYINYQGSAMYTQRIPIRRYKQGLDYSALAIDGRPGTGMGKILLKSCQFLDAVADVYPNLDDCQVAIDRYGMDSLAFHREWALSREGAVVRVKYKGREVGKLQNGEVVLSKSKFFLREALNEVVGHG